MALSVRLTVVKVEMSKFKRKNKKHKSEERDREEELKIIWTPPGATKGMEVLPAYIFVHGY